VHSSYTNICIHQHICCALPWCRAFLKAPRILLFDEATSALDARTEREILESLAQLASGRTSIFVAHRLSTAAQCDQIVVLDEGQVLESGSHGELLAKNGRYAELWARQATVDDLYDPVPSADEETLPEEQQQMKQDAATAAAAGSEQVLNDKVASST
jgi:ABC-type multidrug transport system ATPase subunit